MNFDLNEWYLALLEQQVVFSYKGEVTSEVISQVLDSIETKIGNLSESSKVVKRLYNVSVESIQNLFHHIDKPPIDFLDLYGENFAIFVVSKDANGYKISTGNFIRSTKVKILKDRIDQINYLTKHELKALYKLVLNNDEFSQKGGGGLGMIDIVKRTGNKLDYGFRPVKDDSYFFSLEAYVT